MPFFLDLPELQFPSTKTQIFRRDAPLVLEIGFGDGRFLEWIATSHPKWNCLGADISNGSVARTFRRLRHANLSNVRLHHGSGLFLLRNVLSNESVQRIYVNFPDPWQKKKYSDKRLFRPVFFEVLATRLATGGRLLVTTDDAAYFEQILSLACRSGYYTVTRTSPPSAVLRTRYALKWRKSGRSFYHAQIQKDSGHTPEIHPTIQKEEDMHHIHLKGSIPVITEFEKVIHHFPDGHVVILDAMQMIGAHGLVFVVRSYEPELVQELLVQLCPAQIPGADLLLSIRNFGKPIATRGTKEAVKAVSLWLTQRGLLISSTYY